MRSLSYKKYAQRHILTSGTSENPIPPSPSRNINLQFLLRIQSGSSGVVIISILLGEKSNTAKPVSFARDSILHTAPIATVPDVQVQQYMIVVNISWRSSRQIKVYKIHYDWQMYTQYLFYPSDLDLTVFDFAHLFMWAKNCIAFLHLHTLMIHISDPESFVRIGAGHQPKRSELHITATCKNLINKYIAYETCLW